MIQKKERMTNIELLRIILMFIIVYSHFATHSTFEFKSEMSINHLLLQITRLGEVGVTGFVIISGYFSIKKDKTYNKTLNLIIEVWIYNVCIIGMMLIMGKVNSITGIVHSVVPIYNTHWFAYVFIFLYLLVPYINIFLKNLEKRNFRRILLILGLFWGFLYPLTGADFNFSYLGWFIFLYMLGAYKALYPSKIEIRKSILIIVSCMLGLIISTILIDYIEWRLDIPLDRYSNYFYSLYSPMIWVLGSSLFDVFLSINLGTKKFINMISKSVFAVYIISDNPYIRNLLWNNWFNNIQYSDSKYLLLIGAVETSIIFFVCISIDKIRKFILKDKIDYFINDKIKKIKFRKII